MKRSIVVFVIVALLLNQFPLSYQRNSQTRLAIHAESSEGNGANDYQLAYPVEGQGLSRPPNDSSPMYTYPVEGLPSNPEPIILPEEDEPEEISIYEPELLTRPLPIATPWLKLITEPAIFVPGAANSISWSLKDYETMLLDGSENLIITLANGLLPADATLAAQYLAEGSLKIPLTATEGLIFLEYQSEVTSTARFTVNFTLVHGEKLLDTNAVVWPCFNSKAQSLLTSPENQLGISLSSLEQLNNPNIVFMVDVPSPHTLPGISLTGSPFEVLAANVVTGTTVNRFTSPITLTVPYKMDRFQSDQEADLQLFYYHPENQDWFPLETVVDTVNKTLSAQTDHLTVFDYKPGEWQSYIPPILESYQVSEFTGAATYQIDLPAFEGPNGLKPELSLRYNSQIIDEGSAYSQAGWVGMGWALETGMITRDMHGTNGITDDSFLLSASGTSGRLLPVGSSGTITSYAVSQASFDKIEFDSASNSWTVYRKDGLVYLFGDGALGGTSFNVKFSPSSGCAASPDNLVNWGWALKKITDRFGNEIDFAYDIQKKSGCLNDLAILPSAISYAGGQFEINFVPEDRFDYLPGWNDANSRVLFSKKRLDIVVFLVNGVVVKTYDLSYGNAQNQYIVLPDFEWQSGALTSTLVSFRELGVDGSTLPATSFEYFDYLHLTHIYNGYGGEVIFGYEQYAFFDDYNDNLRMANWIFGETQCNPNDPIRLWTDWIAETNVVGCENSFLLLRQHDQSKSVVAIHSIPENIVQPGSKYRFYIQGKSNQNVGTETFWGFKGGGAQYKISGVLPDWNSPLGNFEGSILMPVDYDINQAKLFVENTGSYIKKLQVVLYVTRYTVSSRTEIDRVASTSATWSYTYEDMAFNSGGTGFYVSKNREFLGFGKVIITHPGGPQVTNTYSQTVTEKGLLNSSQVSDPQTDQVLAKTHYSYKTDELVSNAALASSDGTSLAGYPDLDVLWTRPGSIETLTYLPSDSDGQIYYIGTKTRYDYNECVNNAGCELATAKNQGSGNLSGTIFFTKENDNGWVADQADWVSFQAPLWSGGAWLGQIPLARKTVHCVSEACGPDLPLLKETLYSYHPNWQVKYQRDWALGDATARQYSLTLFDYHPNGSLAITRVWQDFFDSTSDPGSTSPYSQTQRLYEGSFPNAVTSQITSTSDGRTYQTLSTVYDERFGLPLRVTLQENNAAEGAAYDALGRMTKICAPGDWDPTLPCADAANTGTVEISYFQTLPYQMQVSTPGVAGSARQYFYYDGFGRLLQTQLVGALVEDTFQNQVIRAVAYDDYGREVLSTQPFTYPGIPAYQASPFGDEHHVTWTDYDLLGRVLITGRRGAAGTLSPTAVYSYTLHADGANWLLKTSVTDANQHTSMSLTNSKGQLILSSPPEATGPSTRFSYDSLGRLTGSQYGNTFTSLSYYPSGLKSQMADPDMGTWSYSYDAQGNLTSQHDARGNTTTLSYDLLGRLISKTFSDGSEPISYTYDENSDAGYRTGMSDASGSTAWDYDERGRLIREEKTLLGQVLTTQWAYDSADQVISMTYPDGEVVGYTHLPQGGVASVGGYLAGTRVNANGQRDLMTFGNGTQTSFTYKDWLTDGGRLGTLQSGLPDTLVNLSLGYDPAGNITQITDGLNAGQVQSFSYDTLNRLTETGTNSVGEGQYSQTYTYDPATGNLSSKSDLGDYTYSPTQPHAVTQAGTNSYAYDQNGNMTSRTVSGMVWTYIYNAENQLAQVKKNDQLISEYGYDGDGKRVWAKDYEGFLSTNPKVTRYIGNYYEVRVEGYKPDSGGAPSQSCSAPSYCAYFPFIARTLVENVSYYYADGQRIAMKNNGVVTYLYGDQLGSTTATADVNGNPVSQTLYHPWGTNRFSQGTSPTDYTYTGQRQEGDIYFYNARWYDPQLGRFMQADTIVPIAQGTQGFDRYAYVNNNPLIFNDPSGHRFCEDNYAKGCNVASSAFTLQFTFGSYNFGFGKANNIDRYNDDVISPSVISSNPFVIFVSLIDFFGRILQDFSPISDTDYRGPQVNWLVISEDYGEMIKIKNIHLVSDDTVTLERISIYRNTSRVSLFNFRPSTIANLEYGFDTGEVGTYEVDPLIVDLTPQSLLLEFRLKCYECAGNKGLNSFGYNPYPFIPTTNLSYIRDWRSKNER